MDENVLKILEDGITESVKTAVEKGLVAVRERLTSVEETVQVRTGQLEKAIAGLGQLSRQTQESVDRLAGAITNTVATTTNEQIEPLAKSVKSLRSTVTSQRKRMSWKLTAALWGLILIAGGVLGGMVIDWWTEEPLPTEAEIEDQEYQTSTCRMGHTVLLKAGHATAPERKLLVKLVAETDKHLTRKEVREADKLIDQLRERLYPEEAPPEKRSRPRKKSKKR